MEATAAIELEPGVDSLQHAVTSCDWRIEIVGPTLEAATARVAEVLAAEEVPVTVTRKGSDSEIDARPAILAPRIVEPDAPRPGLPSLPPTAVLQATLAPQPPTLRPPHARKRVLSAQSLLVRFVFCGL